MVQIASNLLLFVLSMIAFYHGIMLIPGRAKRWRPLEAITSLKEEKLPSWLFKFLGLRLKMVEEKQQLLLGCGFRLNASLYEAARRMLMCTAILASGAGYAALKRPIFTLNIAPAYVLSGAVCLLLLLVFDKKLLSQLKARRAHRIVREIYVISHHLLYYNDSRMSLHTKLSLCAAQTRSIRMQFGLLLNEWYQGAETAITQFKMRLGTDEAHSFGETLNALRMNEHTSYYELLKQRIQDYKEKMDLVRDSKKEAVSYVLFVLAGLPIMNTFRVFMYPWIAEGQRLFDAIN